MVPLLATVEVDRAPELANEDVPEVEMAELVFPDDRPADDELFAAPVVVEPAEERPLEVAFEEEPRLPEDDPEAVAPAMAEEVTPLLPTIEELLVPEVDAVGTVVEAEVAPPLTVAPVEPALLVVVPSEEAWVVPALELKAVEPLEVGAHAQAP